MEEGLYRVLNNDRYAMVQVNQDGTAVAVKKRGQYTDLSTPPDEIPSIDQLGEDTLYRRCNCRATQNFLNEARGLQIDET